MDGARDYGDHDIFQSGIQSGCDTGEKGCAMWASLHHRSRTACACAVDHRGVPALDGWSAEPRRVVGDARGDGHRVRATPFGRSTIPASGVGVMYLLDTNVVSELRRAKAGRANPHVVAWAANIPVASLFVSVVTVLELEWGVLRIERRDAEQGALLRIWLEEQVLPAFSERILPVDSAVARYCARLHVPDPRSERDAFIAATALTHGLIVATRNVADFQPTGVKIFNPWTPAVP